MAANGKIEISVDNLVKQQVKNRKVDFLQKIKCDLENYY